MGTADLVRYTARRLAQRTKRRLTRA
jgi:hypothetical protein